MREQRGNDCRFTVAAADRPPFYFLFTKLTRELRTTAPLDVDDFYF